MEALQKSQKRNMLPLRQRRAPGRSRPGKAALPGETVRCDLTPNRFRAHGFQSSCCAPFSYAANLVHVERVAGSHLSQKANPPSIRRRRRGPAVSPLGHAATLSPDGRVLCYHQETRRMTHCRAPSNRQNYLMDHPKLGKLGPPGQQGSRTRWQKGKSTRLETVWSTRFRCGRWPHSSAREMRTGTGTGIRED